MPEIFDDINFMNLMNPKVAPFFIDGDKKDECVLLIHGFTGTPAHMKVLAEYLNDDGKGYPVYGILLPGHGTKKEDMLQSNWKDWVLYSSKKLEVLLSHYNKVNIVGFSMGGNVALCLATKNKVNKVVCICTPIAIKNKLYFIAEFLSFFKKYTKWKKKNPVPGEYVFDFEPGYDAMPVKSIGQMRNITIATYNRLKRIKQPILIAQSLKDKTVHLKSPYIIFDKTKSGYKELLLLENSGHNPMTGLERDKLFCAVDEFLKRKIPKE